MQQEPSAMQNPTETNPNPSVTDMRRAFDAFGIQKPTTNSGQSIVEVPQNSGEPRDSSTPDIPKLGGTSLQGRVLAPAGGSNTPNVSLPLDRNYRSDISQHQVQQAATSLQHNVINDMFCLASGAEAAVNEGVDSHLPGDLQLGQKTASEVSGSKEWHQTVTPELRNHLVHKLVRAIFPSSDPQALRDKRIHNLVAYAQRVEGDMYEMANSRSEYYHLLAEEIYKIQKELEEKRQKRKELQMQHQSQVQANSRSNLLTLGSANGCSEPAE